MEVVLTGLCSVLDSVVVVVLCVVGIGASLTVVQAVSDTKVAAARQEMISLFMGRIVSLVC